MRKLTSFCAVLALLGGAAACGSSKPVAPTSTATTSASAGSPLSRCVSAWNANTASPSGHEIAAAAAREGHTNGYVFIFSGGQCGVQIGGVAEAVWADIGSTGHFEPWLRNVNGSPAVTTSLVASLASDAESHPNVTFASDGSASPVPGGEASQISQPVDLPKERFTEVGTEGPANTEPYNINASAWNQQSTEQQLGLLVKFASHGGCSVEAARDIASAIRGGTFKVEENDVSNTLAHACANPASIPTSATKGAGESNASTPGATTSGNCRRITPYVSDISASGMTCEQALEFANRAAFKAPSCWPRAQTGALATCEFEGRHCESAVVENHADIVCTTTDSKVGFSVADAYGHIHPRGSAAQRVTCVSSPASKRKHGKRTRILQSQT